VLSKIAEDRAAVASLKVQTGIADEAIFHLIGLATPQDRRSDDSSEPLFDYHFYTGLFLALYLEKKGYVAMHSPAFKGLLKSLFPDKPDSVWQNL
jgi:hypothetical protein